MYQRLLQVCGTPQVLSRSKGVHFLKLLVARFKKSKVVQSNCKELVFEEYDHKKLLSVSMCVC